MVSAIELLDMYAEKYMDVEIPLNSNAMIRFSNGKQFKVDTVYMQYNYDKYPKIMGFAHNDRGNYSCEPLGPRDITNLDISGYVNDEGDVLKPEDFILYLESNGLI